MLSTAEDPQFRKSPPLMNEPGPGTVLDAHLVIKSTIISTFMTSVIKEGYIQLGRPDSRHLRMPLYMFQTILLVTECNRNMTKTYYFRKC